MPELSAGLTGIPGLPWESLSHRQVLAELAAGWGALRAGDWAVALRSPEGTVVARVWQAINTRQVRVAQRDGGVRAGSWQADGIRRPGMNRAPDRL